MTRMTLLRIEKTMSQAGRVRLVFDDGSRRMVYPTVVADLGLYSGMELDEDAMARLERTIGAASAKNRAARILAAGDVSKRDLRRRLVAKGEKPGDADDAVRWLEDLQLLDDERTARQIVQRGVRRGYGRARIRQMLYEKQIPREYWDDALAQIPDMSDAIDRFLAQKLRGTDAKSVKRAVDALLRRGYSYSEIKAALARVQWDEEDDLEDEL